MKNNQIQAIYDDYINGNRRDMTDKIDAYGLYDVFCDLQVYLHTREQQWPVVNAVLVDIVITYHHIRHR